MIQQTTAINPAAQTLLTAIQPYLRPGVIAVVDIDVPGKELDFQADVLLAGEYETVIVRLSADTPLVKDWKPAHPIGLLTEIYSLSAASLFYHLDDFVYLLSAANPSLFVADASLELRRLASETLTRVENPWSGGILSVGYPGWSRSDLEISRQTSIHGGFAYGEPSGKAA